MYDGNLTGKLSETCTRVICIDLSATFAFDRCLMMSNGIDSFRLKRISAILEAIESQLRRWCKGLKAWQGEVGDSTDQHKFNVLFRCMREP